MDRGEEVFESIAPGPYGGRERLMREPRRDRLDPAEEHIRLLLREMRIVERNLEEDVWRAGLEDDLAGLLVIFSVVILILVVLWIPNVFHKLGGSIDRAQVLGN